MRNLLFKSLGILSFIGVSCSSELEQLPISQQDNKKKVETGIVRNIRDYVHYSKLGGLSGRSADEYTLSPYVYKGDTIMYIVNYRSGGWELLSTDYRSPLVLVSSDTGSFDPKNGLCEAAAVNAYMSLIEEDLTDLSATPFDSSMIDNSWRTVTLFENEIETANIQVSPKATGVQPGTNGSWVLIESTTPQVTTVCPARLTTTNWQQGSPWNEYVPYLADMSAHAPAGCSPVAVAQYLYYLHYKNGNPISTVTEATYHSSTNTYSYSGSSSTVWDLMAKTSYNSGTEYAAMLIGYVGQSCGTNYAQSGGEGSSTSVAAALSFINSFGYEYYNTAIDYDYIYRRLQAGHAILASASCTDTDCGSHRFIIDGYEKTTATYTNIYGWVGEDNYGNDSNDYDDDGNVIGYFFTYEDEVENVTWKLMMNWGYSSYTNSLKFTTSNWNAGGHYFNSNRNMFRE